MLFLKAARILSLFQWSPNFFWHRAPEKLELSLPEPWMSQISQLIFQSLFLLSSISNSEGKDPTRISQTGWIGTKLFSMAVSLWETPPLMPQIWRPSLLCAHRLPVACCSDLWSFPKLWATPFWWWMSSLEQRLGSTRGVGSRASTPHNYTIPASNHHWKKRTPLL